MRKLSVFFFLLIMHDARADHIAGGEMFYRHLGTTGNNHNYTFTLKFYRHCNSHRDFQPSTIISVFNRATGERVENKDVPMNRREVHALGNTNPCITDPPKVCFEVAYYIFELSLPAVPGGYLIASQVNFRINGMKNLVAGYGNVGATYTAEIPGTGEVADANVNRSARFIGSDLEILCANNRFSYSFAAEDADGDQLRYSLCNAYQTQGGFGGGNNNAPPPPYTSIPYGPGFSGQDPLGSNVQINPTTGLITGIAPADGQYVITVCVQEVRNGLVIATQRKDIQITVSRCNVASASLLPQYQLCKDTRQLQLSNLSTSNLITSYNWTLTTLGGTQLSSSTQPVFGYSFADTGTYKLHLRVAANNICEDSITTRIIVYPGFIPGFTFSGDCFLSPFQFRDLTIPGYGFVSNWQWNFGEPAAPEVTTNQNPSFLFSNPGERSVQLIATSSKGCRDTIVRRLSVLGKPLLKLPFRDTLICSMDTLGLKATTDYGTLSWIPSPSMIHHQSPMPQVFPKDTTTYTVVAQEKACISRDSVKVNVLDFITVGLIPDTTICKTDVAVLQPQSHGLQYIWSPGIGLNNANIKNPRASPLSDITYHVLARLGKCNAEASIRVKVVPYPGVQAGADTLICHQTTASLHATIQASSFNWSPAGSLAGANTLDPVASPVATTPYVLTVYDTLGCPKPSRDTVIVIVQPKIEAFAGNDTVVVAHQPLQFNATGGTAYLWSPGFYLNNTSVNNPLAVYDGEADSITYTVRVSRNNCHAFDQVTVKIFQTDADIFVPSAFTPDGDGRNDLLRPIPIGIKELKSFRIFNRWGQLLFETGQAARGWDGKVKGIPQGSNVFVYVVVGTTYLGQQIVRKGTVTLIRK